MTCENLEAGKWYYLDANDEEIDRKYHGNLTPWKDRTPRKLLERSGNTLVFEGVTSVWTYSQFKDNDDLTNEEYQKIIFTEYTGVLELRGIKVGEVYNGKRVIGIKEYGDINYSIIYFLDNKSCGKCGSTIRGDYSDFKCNVICAFFSKFILDNLEPCKKQITINDLKVGMKVKIRDDLKINCKYGSMYYSALMKKGIVEINDVLTDFILIEGDWRKYTPEMVEYIVEENVVQMRYDSGRGHSVTVITDESKYFYFDETMGKIADKIMKINKTNEVEKMNVENITKEIEGFKTENLVSGKEAVLEDKAKYEQQRAKDLFKQLIDRQELLEREISVRNEELSTIQEALKKFKLFPLTKKK